MIIRPATPQDIDALVSLSYEKRRAYEKAQRQFWRYAEGAETGGLDQRSLTKPSASCFIK
jgi:hypothetical protein